MSTSTSPLIDSELQNQIDLLFEKSLSDLKIRTVKLVAKHYNKVLKDKSKNVKNSQSHSQQHPTKAAKPEPRQIPVSHKKASAPRASSYSEDEDEYSTDYSDS